MRKQLPNLLTLFNLTSGCLSIIFLFSGDIFLASWMVGVAVIFDFFDGLAARLLHASSDLGKVLDSLADMVSFGVAPGLILFRLIDISSSQPTFLTYIALIIPVFSAIRLAIFSADERQKHHFIGVPTPLNGLMLASIPLVLLQFGENTLVYIVFSNPWFLVGVVIVSSLLLVAPFRILSLKFRSTAWKDSQSIYVLALIFGVLVILLGYLAMPFFYLAYILLSFFDNQIKKL
jgi:CDP-diacylglycerol--serine O-phosphatidyltransferase